MRIVATSDTHYTVDVKTIPDGDVFMHCGDLMRTGYPSDFEKQLEWLAELPHEIKLFTPGNHDFHLKVYPGPALQQLRDVGVWVVGLPGNENYSTYKLPNGMNVLGLPYVTNLPRWAFNETDAYLGEFLARQRSIDIVMSHAPPKHILDSPKPGINVGIQAYRDFARYHKPEHWFFGHIHECYGHEVQFGTEFWNVAMCDRSYKHSNPAVVVDL
jgi:Predicted phosphoesterases, related to the Icc protein